LIEDTKKDFRELEKKIIRTGGLNLKSYIKKAYDKAVLIINNGHSYEFYSKFKLNCKPTEVFFGDSRNYALENNLKYMNEDDFKELWDWIERDGMPFVWGIGITDFFSKHPGKSIESINKLKKEIIEFEELKMSENKINKDKEGLKELINNLAALEKRVANLEKLLVKDDDK